MKKDLWFYGFIQPETTNLCTIESLMPNGIEKFLKEISDTPKHEKLVREGCRKFLEE